ncbi:GNAT family N-acetyltransferase [Rhizobium leguminosarum]|uniref:GNAT family N-acetyltransferase n=1 Tax=Rhizobium leguminosarum TaxID=384 RepID=A0A6P0BIF7_RHILE|nr:GNAT family N-acetyltransferase [Rhizobium leguminosarum]MBY5441551.1 GNAT family N-acetyltransferase [Rhizobium leguminosarum]NEI37762.1 GNAT family N-acetyltransferase [Rhizobium leguminosarum]NEI44403.1 GNAT family N-acetyltransferase [Rhizobium leguminosarum]
MLENEFKSALPSAVRRAARLRLRIPVEGDIDFLTRLFSRPELVAHRPVPRPDTPAESAERLARDIGHWKDHGFGRWAVEANGALIGFGGVTVSKEFDDLNLSYHLQPESWGQEYATELVRETLTFAFDNLHADRVIGLVRPVNAASKRILEKCGFTFDREVMLHGAPTNMYAFGKTSGS